MRILMSGASGLIGGALKTQLIERGHNVVALVRRKSNNGIFWDIDRNELHSEELEGFDYIFHLAGESIATRWTDEKKNLIYSSRVNGTRLLVDRISKLKLKPKAFISVSAISVYEESYSHQIEETSAAGSDFLAKVCLDWERESHPVQKMNIRLVNPRIGIVLSKEGGALQKMLLPFRLGLGGQLGSGKQIMPWIDIEDIVRAFVFCIESEIDGPINFTAPNPVSQEEFAKSLAARLNRPSFLRTPEFILKAVAGEMANELLLKSYPVYPKRLLEAGFQFKYANLDDSLEHLLSRT